MGTHRKRRRVVHLSVVERVIIALAVVAIGVVAWDVHRRWAAGPGVSGLATDVYEAGRPRPVAPRRPAAAPATVATRATPQPLPPEANPYVQHPTTYTRAVASPHARAATPSGAPAAAPASQDAEVRFPTWSDAEPRP